jgi:hypothetical protein
MQREGVTHSIVHSSLFTSQDKQQTQEKASLVQECTRPFEDRGREDRGAGQEGYLRSSRKGKEGTQQMGADKRRIHRRAVRHRSRQTSHRLPRTISAPASVDAHSAPSSLPPKHSAAGMRATPPALPPSETLYRWCAHKPLDSLLSKHSTTGVRAMPPAFSLRNSPSPTCAQRP